MVKMVARMVITCATLVIMGSWRQTYANLRGLCYDNYSGDFFGFSRKNFFVNYFESNVSIIFREWITLFRVVNYNLLTIIWRHINTIKTFVKWLQSSCDMRSTYVIITFSAKRRVSFFALLAKNFANFRWAN
jgi:hypothetical protein